MSATNLNEVPYPNWVCYKCGVKANILTCLQRYGNFPLKWSFEISTWHTDICDVCGKHDDVTQARDFFHPDFKLLNISKRYMYKPLGEPDEKSI